MWNLIKIYFYLVIFSGSLNCLNVNETNIENSDNSTFTTTPKSVANIAEVEETAVKVEEEDHKTINNESDYHNIFNINYDHARAKGDKGEPDSTNFIETTRKWLAIDTDEKNKDTEENTNNLMAICPKLNVANITEFDLNKMTDVWQSFYYKMPEKVLCFKILIRKTTPEEKLRYEKKYGSFNGKVEWSKCNLEIRSSSRLGIKHLLQGVNGDDGVLRNVIIIDTSPKVKGEVENILKEESADQWFVTKNILLMRDCDTGGIVAFSRVPRQPSREELISALILFGDDEKDGNLTCGGDDLHVTSFDIDIDEVDS